MRNTKRTLLLFLTTTLTGLASPGDVRAAGPLPEPPPFSNAGTTRIDVTEPQAQLIADCGLAATPANPNDGEDDGCAIQSALDVVAAAGGGVVYLPIGVYDVDRTLVVADSTWVVGAGSDTYLVRGPSATSYSAYGLECSSPVQVSSHQLFVNRGYNCGNRGITLFNFTIDGSRVQVQGSPVIGFSAVTDTHIWNLSIFDAPGDAIYLRNGGIRTSVRNTTIRGFRGAGVAVEMFGDGYIGDRSNALPNRRPAVVLSGNEITSVSGQGATFGIRFDRPQLPTLGEAPRALIQENTIDVTDGQTGVSCVECVDTTILDNRVHSFWSGGDGTFTGIYTTGRNIRVINNEIVGRRMPRDGSGIVVRHPESSDVANTDATVVGNVVLGKRIDPTFAPPALIEVSGIWRVVVKNNTVTDVQNGPGIAIGDCVSDSPGTSDIFVASNSVTTTFGASASGYALRRTDDDVHFINNELDGQSLDVAEIDRCDAQLPNQY